MPYSKSPGLTTEKIRTLQTQPISTGKSRENLKSSSSDTKKHTQFQLKTQNSQTLLLPQKLQNLAHPLLKLTTHQ
jgi:hypothetical protein